MTFATKKYTRPVLLNDLKKLPAKSFNNYNTFVNSFSPRAGSKSAKLNALKKIVGARTLRLALALNNNGRNAKGILINFVKTK